MEADFNRDGSSLKCCCGQSACAYLEHNNTALGGLERDLETAARLGQALLSRHESYISESQAEHTRMSAYISELESERTSLQSANEKIVAENRNLLSQLETLNTTLASSDEEVRRLENLLLDCELELKRLNGFVRRAEELDGKVHDMEIERQALTRQLNEGRGEARGTLARWRESERKVRELEEDVRRIEREAMQEREKHQEIMARVEKERMLERELGGAEGRLKGAAAMQSIQNGAAVSKNVVSHFVRDILQDNANLQAGIAELRQLLQTSNEEVQNLREQIMLHQPVEEEQQDDDDELIEPETRRTVSLGEELAHLRSSPQQVQQEVHVHHHYHAKLAKKDRAPTVRRTSRKRAIVPQYPYPYGPHYPPPNRHHPSEIPSGTSTPFSLAHPQPKRNNRWSVQSSTTQSSVLSSIPSSPRSYFDRGGYLFDRMEQQGEDYSRPTSPESMADFQQQNWKQASSKGEDVGLGIFEEEFVTDEGEVLSPLTTQEKSKGVEELPEQDDVQHDTTPRNTDQEQKAHEEVQQREAVAEPNVIREQVVLLPEQHSEQELTPKPSILLHRTTAELDDMSTREQVIQSESIQSEDQSLLSREDARPEDTTRQTTSVLDKIPELRPSLNRRGSHESLVSISGMDIHLAQRPAPAATLELLRGNSAHFALSPTQSRKISASRPLASVTEYTVLSSSGFESSPSLVKSVRRVPSSIEALSGIAIPAPRSAKSPQATGTLSKLVGGWVRGKWGIAPTKSNPNLRVVSSPEQHNKSDTRSLAPSTSSASDSIRTVGGTSISESSSILPPVEESSKTTSAVGFSNAELELPPTASPPKAIPNPATTQSVYHHRQARHRRSQTSIHIGSSSLSPDPTIKSTYSESYLAPGMLFAGRSPGVNQPGFMAGFRQTRNPSVIEPQAVDEEGLREGLNG